MARDPFRPPPLTPERLEARVGETVRVRLSIIPHPAHQHPDPPSTPLLRYLRREWEPAPRPVVGEWGYDVFVFEARAVGEGRLELSPGGPVYDVRIHPAPSSLDAR